MNHIRCLFGLFRKDTRTVTDTLPKSVIVESSYRKGGMNPPPDHPRPNTRPHGQGTKRCEHCGF